VVVVGGLLEAVTMIKWLRLLSNCMCQMDLHHHTKLHKCGLEGRETWHDFAGVMWCGGKGWVGSGVAANTDALGEHIVLIMHT
jgi:hypothetical protein